MTTFNLPDLGEGLPEAEIVAWHVKEGDHVEVDQPMLSVETAKAVVEVPSPYAGTIAKLHARAGDTVETGKPLVDFEGTAGAAKAAPEKESRGAKDHDPAPSSAGQGMVVGHMASSDEEFVDRAIAGGSSQRRAQGRVRAAPAVRMLAKRLKVALESCRATGRHGLVSVDDVLAVANLGTTRARSPSVPGLTDADRLRGTRKAMAQSMSLSRDEIAMCTIFDDADIETWPKGEDITARLIRAIVAGAKAEPGLNALFDPSGPARKLMNEVHLAIAVDTGEGLIVPVLRDVGAKSAAEVREALNGLKERTRNRSVSPDEMRDYTFTLSNFGTMAGRYATPLVVPPTVAILGSGKLQRDVVAGATAPEIHTRIPLSLTFDHRCITGGEACRFLAAVIADLNQPN
jgi:pyruvate dehydrogenase E2 component (dihydrolipoamide acetyltransferase)